MRIDLRGRRALVTGSTAGIGFATAEALARAGADVVINGRSADGVAAALARLERSLATGGESPGPIEVAGFVGDLGERGTIDALVAQHPAFDVVVNNIGSYGPEDFFDLADEQWASIFESNVMSGVRTARAFLPGMVERGWGRAVFVSSESAINIPTDMIHYGVTKTAQLALARGLAKRVAGTGVTVNAVLPGPTMTEGVAAMLDEGRGLSPEELAVRGEDFVRTHRSSSLIRRLARVDEVANMIAYVCSPLSSATTGAALRVDGGVVESIV